MKQTLIVVSVLVLVSVLISGCGLVKLAMTPDSDNCSLFTVGKTTKKEVERQFGKPDSVKIFADGKSATYSKGNMIANALFNSDGTLKQIECVKE